MAGYRGEPATIYELHGDLIFSSAESLARHLVESPPPTRRVGFDVDRVDEVGDVARRMMHRAAESLLDDGHTLTVVDRNGVLGGAPWHPGSQHEPG